jgi:hypothetical protein
MMRSAAALKVETHTSLLLVGEVVTAIPSRHMQMQYYSWFKPSPGSRVNVRPALRIILWFESTRR